MTAFNSIKTNNWPAASNDLEDFLVLELPLNDQAALTSSRRDIVAGSTVLHPKQTLTNTGVSMVAAVTSGVDYGATGFTKSTNWRTDYANPEIGLFNGDGTATQAAVNGDNAEHWYGFPTPLTNVTKVETRMGHDGNQSARAYMGNGTTGYVSSAGSGVYFTVYNGAATTFSKIGWRSNNGSGASIYDIRVTDNTGTYVLTSAVHTKKHYDDNATLVSGSSNYLQTVDMASVSDSDYTYECYALADGTPSSWSLFHTNPTSRKGILALFTSATNIQLYFGNGGSWTSIHDFTVSVDNAWHHYAVVRQNGGDVSLYMDGVLKGTHTPGAHTHGDLVIGRQSGDNNLYWNGPVQDFRVYRTAKYTANFTPPGAILG